MSSRRSLVYGCLASAGAFLAGCSTLANDSNSEPDWASSSDLAIYNETASEQQLEVTLFEIEGEPDSDTYPYTVTTESTQPAEEPLYEREFRVQPDEDVWEYEMLTKPEEKRVYRLSVRLSGGKKAAYVFSVQYGSGLTLLRIEILSPSKVRFSELVV